MAKSTPLDPNVPAGSEDPKLGDNRIRELAAAVAELLAVDHYMGDDGGAGAGYNEDAAGEHAKVTLRVGSAPTSEANKGHIYAKDVSGKAELFYKDEDGDEIQITKAGVLIDTTPLGAMVMWPTDTPPSLWLLCSGQAVSRTTYSDLYALIGTVYGIGDGSTTFNVPDIRGRIPLGKDNMGGSSADRVTDTDADTLGGADGSETHTLTTAQLPAHTHSLDKDGDAFKSGGSSGINSSGAGSWNTGPTGSGSAHNNMPPYLTLNYIIKAL